MGREGKRELGGDGEGALLLSSSLQNMEVDLRIVFSLLLRRLLNESAASRRMGDNAKHMSASSLLQV